jgi:hypothetical protein
MLFHPSFHPDDNPRILGPYGQHCSNYIAVITVIEMALCKILVDFENGSITLKNTVAFSD